MKKILVTFLTVVCVMALFVSTAFAAVSFNPSTGVGFVGKGDVQTAFGWNNAQLQKNASAVIFIYKVTEEYEVTVEWTTGQEGKNQKVHTKTRTELYDVNSCVAFDVRQKNQITGFNLLGLEDLSVIGESIPEIGEVIVDRSGNTPTDTTVIAVEAISSSGGLYAVFNGTSVLIG